MENRNKIIENKKGKKQQRRKVFFEQSEEKRASHPMTALEMAHLTSKYNNKYKIKIEMNGVTEQGQKAIKESKENEENKIKQEQDSTRFEQHHKQVESFMKSIIGSTEEDKIKNENEYKSTIVDMNVIIDEFKILRDKYVALANECNFLFKPYPEGIDEIIDFISKEYDENPTDELKNNCLKYIESLKNLIDQYKQISESEKMNQVLKDKISDYEIERQTRLDDIGLTKQQAINEINEIRKGLKNDEVIGYVFTNNHLIKKNHFDVILITKDLIIKPCEWNVDEEKTIGSSDIKNLSCLELIEPFVSHENKNCSLPYAQSGPTECGTLGMLNLKELLKNNSYQLKNFTMNVPFYDKDEKLHYLFIPSPDVLRYSQSSTFNNIILSMFSDEPEVKIKFSQMVLIDFWANKKEKQEDVATVKTIVAMLKDTMEKAEKKGDKEIVNTCQTLLNQLPEFREKWMKNYNSAMSKRKSMQGESFNEYLAYSTQRLRDRASEHTQSDEKHTYMKRK